VCGSAWFDSMGLLSSSPFPLIILPSLPLYLSLLPLILLLIFPFLPFFSSPHAYLSPCPHACLTLASHAPHTRLTPSLSLPFLSLLFSALLPFLISSFLSLLFFPSLSPLFLFFSLKLPPPLSSLLPSSLSPPSFFSPPPPLSLFASTEIKIKNCSFTEIKQLHVRELPLAPPLPVRTRERLAAACMGMPMHRLCASTGFALVCLECLFSRYPDPRCP